MKTIVALTDFSNNAYSAIFYAARLFEDEPAQFIILNSFEDELTRHSTRIDFGISKKEVTNFYEKAKAKCITVQRKLKGDLETTNHKFKIKVSSLKLTKAVNKLIDKGDIDLVVMGTQGQTAAKNVFLGSNSYKVLKKIKHTSLLIIPDEIDYVVPKKIGFGTGFNYRYESEQLQLILELSKRFNADFKVICVTEDKEPTETQKENFYHLFDIAGGINPEYNWLPEATSKYHALMDCIEKESLDLFALAYYKHGFISSLFREKVIKNISRNIDIPLFILPGVA